MLVTEKKLSRLRNCLQVYGHIFVCVALLLLILWTGAALHFDVRIAWLRIPCILVYVLALIAASSFSEPSGGASSRCLSADFSARIREGRPGFEE